MTRVTQSSSSEPSFFSAPYVEEFLEGCITGAVVGAITHVALSRFNLTRLMPALNSLNFYGTCELAKKLLNGEKLADSMPKFWGEICGGFLVGGLISQLCEGVLAVRSPQYSVLGKYKGGLGAPPVVPPSEMALAFKSGERSIFGYTRAEYLAEMRKFQAFSPEARIKYHLECAKQNRAAFTIQFPDKDLSYIFDWSPIGCHKTPFLALQEELLAMGEVEEEFRAACYAGGFHDTTAFLEKMLPQSNVGARSMIEGLKRAERKVFQSGLLGQSNDPRELARLLMHNRPGKLLVFDPDLRVINSLRDSRFIKSDSLAVIDGLYRQPPQFLSEKRELQEYWENEILRGRFSVLQKFLHTDRGSFYFDIADFPEHLTGVQPIKTCFITSNKMDYSSHPFLASVYLEQNYLLSGELRNVVFARILRNSRGNGLILTDLKISEADQALWGVKLVKPVLSYDISGELRVEHYIYRRKVELPEEVDILARLNI